MKTFAKNVGAILFAMLAFWAFGIVGLIAALVIMYAPLPVWARIIIAVLMIALQIVLLANAINYAYAAAMTI